MLQFYSGRKVLRLYSNENGAAILFLVRNVVIMFFIKCVAILSWVSEMLQFYFG